MPPPGGGGKRGIRHQMVSYPPLNSPSSSFKPRLPAVARLNARGPQGRLLLQGHTLDGSRAFRSANQAPCTVWPRTVMRGGLRKVNSGPDSVPKAARRTEPSPRPPFRRATEGSRVLRKGWGVKRGRETLVSLPILSLPGDPGIPRPPKAANAHAHSERKAASSGEPLYRRKGFPSAEGKDRRGSSPLTPLPLRVTINEDYYTLNPIRKVVYYANRNKMPA